MRSRQWTVVSIIVLLAVAGAAAQQRAGGPAPAGPPMTLTIAAFPDGGPIQVKFSQAAPGAAPGEGVDQDVDPQRPRAQRPGSARHMRPAVRRNPAAASTERPAALQASVTVSTPGSRVASRSLYASPPRRNRYSLIPSRTASRSVCATRTAPSERWSQLGSRPPW